MVRKRKALAPLLVALGLALGVFGLLLPDTGSVAAQATPSATRSLPASVAPDEEFVVSITASNYGFRWCIVVETLPDGFTYVSSSRCGCGRCQRSVDGQVVTFTLFEDKTVPNTTFDVHRDRS